MGAYPTEHVPTRNKTLDAVRVSVISEIERLDGMMNSRYLMGQRSAYEKVLKLIAGLRRPPGATE